MKPLILLVGLALVVLPAARGLATELPLRAAPNTPGDTCAAAATAEKLLVDISTQRGIGRATVESTAGPLPKKITLRLRYATGKPLPTLEGLTITGPNFTLEGATARAAEFQLSRHTDKGTPKDAKPLAGEVVAEKQTVTVRATATALEIDLPDNLLGDTRKFEIQWVDYYRN